MAKSVKIVGVFAAFGFLLPAVLLGYYSGMNHFGIYPNTDILFYLCPSSIMCIALDKASTGTAIFVWTVICLENAVLYAVLGSVAAFFVWLLRSKPSSGSGI